MSPRAGGPRRTTPPGRPTTRAARPGPGREQGGQRGKRLGPRHGDAPGSGARRPSSLDTAAARPRRKPPPLAGCRPPAAASVVPAAARLRECPRAQASQPISAPREKSPARGSGRAVECPGGRRSPLRAASRSRPPAPSSPRSPSCHKRPGSAGIRPTPAGARLTAEPPGQSGAGLRGPEAAPRKAVEASRGRQKPGRAAWSPPSEEPGTGGRAFSPLTPAFPGTEVGVGLTRLLAGGGSPGNPLNAGLHTTVPPPLPPTFPSGVSYVLFFFPTKEPFAWILRGWPEVYGSEKQQASSPAGLCQDVCQGAGGGDQT